MKFCVEKHLKKLEKVFEEDKIFEKKLKTTAFLCLLEILFNICRKDKKQRKWFPKEMIKRLKKEKTVLRFLFDKKKSEAKRKKALFKSEPEFQNLVKQILTHFFENCLISD